jgi:hypothetical protein
MNGAGTRLAAAWRRYWFGWSAPLAVEVARMAIALATLHAWNRGVHSSYAAFLATYPEGAYRPLGLLRLFGGDPPPVWCLETLKWVALLGALCVLVGLFTRASLVVTALSMFLLVGLNEAFVKSWHHSYTPLLVAQLAFMFAPAGRRLSLDAILRRRLGRPQPPDPPAWPVLLVQVAAALFFFNAAYWKFRRAGLDWALSDSLRNHILNQFDWACHARTELADFLVHHELAWKAAALANMLTQAAPLAACFFIRRPRIRAFFALFFVAEIVLLDVVMDLPNYHWLPLVVVFVDWDRLVAWIRHRRARRREEDAPPPPEPPLPEMTARQRKLATGFIATFLLVNLGVAFSVKGIDVVLNLYPVSQYTMFSQARAKEPYDVHQSWEFESIRFSIDDMEVGPRRTRLERAMNKRFRRRWGARDPALVERLLIEARNRYRVKRRTLTATYAVQVAPPYPAEPELAVHPVGILGRVAPGTFRSLLGTVGVDGRGRHFVEPHPTGMTLPQGARITCFLGNDPTEHEIEVQAEGGRLYYQPLSRAFHILVAEVGGERFILGDTRSSPAAD